VILPAALSSHPCSDTLDWATVSRVVCLYKIRSKYTECSHSRDPAQCRATPEKNLVKENL